MLQLSASRVLEKGSRECHHGSFVAAFLGLTSEETLESGHGCASLQFFYGLYHRLTHCKHTQCDCAEQLVVEQSVVRQTFNVLCDNLGECPPTRLVALYSYILG